MKKWLLFLFVPFVCYSATGPGQGSGGGTGTFTFNNAQFDINNNTNVTIRAAAPFTNAIMRTGMLLDYATASRPVLTDGGKNLVSGNIDLANTNHITESNTWFVTTASALTNVLNQLNALSPDGVRRHIRLAPGVYSLSTGSFRLSVSNNISMHGAGMYQTEITGHGSITLPMIMAYDNVQIDDMTLTTLNDGAAPALGVNLPQFASNPLGPSSTNVSINRVRFQGDADNIALANDGMLYDPANSLAQGTNDSSVNWTVNDSLFHSRYDCILATGDSSLGANSAPCKVTVNNSRFYAKGPTTNATLLARGEVTVIRATEATGRIELYGCYIYSSGGTNLTSAGFNVNAHGLGDDLFPGGIYYNNCIIEINGTNLVSGGRGGALAISTNGWIVLNGVYCNSNNIIGTGTNFWRLSKYRDVTGTPTAGQALTFDASGQLTNSTATGDVTGPSSSTIFTFPAFANTTGKVLTNVAVGTDGSGTNAYVPGELRAHSSIFTNKIRLPAATSGFTEFARILAASGQSNSFTWNVVNPVAGEVIAIDSVTTSAGTNNIALTNKPAGSGTPGGSTTQVQYNNGGSFDGASGIVVPASEGETNLNVTGTGRFNSLVSTSSVEILGSSAGYWRFGDTDNSHQWTLTPRGTTLTNIHEINAAQPATGVPYYTLSQGTNITKDITNTLDFSSSDITIKLKGYLKFTHPHVFHAATMVTNTASISNGQAILTASADLTANAVKYVFTVPDDLDTNAPVRARLKYRLGGADTAKHEFYIATGSAADSAAYDVTPSCEQGVNAPGDGSGANGDVLTWASGDGWVTMTSWGTCWIAGRHAVIILGRDGDDATNDTSTIDVTTGELTIEYGIIQ